MPWLAARGARAWQFTLLGFALVAGGAVWLAAFAQSGHGPLVAALAIWLGWACDRIDGALARRTGTTSLVGRWLDANLDEVGEVIVCGGLAVALTGQGQSSGWLWAFAWLGGKYLFVHGQREEAEIEPSAGQTSAAVALPVPTAWRRAAQLAGNADVRLHALVGSLLAGALWLPLVVSALYFNARWIARLLLVGRRLAGSTE